MRPEILPRRKPDGSLVALVTTYGQRSTFATTGMMRPTGFRPIDMPCRFCEARPGAACTSSRSNRGDFEMDNFHACRKIAATRKWRARL